MPDLKKKKNKMRRLIFVVDFFTEANASVASRWLLEGCAAHGQTTCLGNI
jgi:hypothetical protein